MTPPLSDQIFEIIDSDPITFSIDTIIATLKTKPQKREVIKAINSLIASHKILRLEDDGKKLYKTTSYVPAGVVVSNEFKFVFVDVSSFLKSDGASHVTRSITKGTSSKGGSGEGLLSQEDLSTEIEKLHKKTWKKLGVFGCCTMDYTGFGPREKSTDIFKILQHTFTSSEIQLSWMIQEKINTLQPPSSPDEKEKKKDEKKKDEKVVSILIVSKHKSTSENIAALVKSRGFKVEHTTDIMYTGKWIG